MRTLNRQNVRWLLHIWHHTISELLLWYSPTIHIELKVLLNWWHVVLDVLGMIVVEVLRWVAILWVHHLLFHLLANLEVHLLGHLAEWAYLVVHLLVQAVILVVQVFHLVIVFLHLYFALCDSLAGSLHTCSLFLFSCWCIIEWDLNFIRLWDLVVECLLPCRDAILLPLVRIDTQTINFKVSYLWFADF